MTRRLGGRATLTLFALLEPITRAIHLQDVDVVSQAVEQGAGQPFGGKEAGPLALLSNFGPAVLANFGPPPASQPRVAPIGSGDLAWTGEPKWICSNSFVG